MKKQPLILSILLMSLLSAPAQAFDLSVLGGLNFYNPSETGAIAIDTSSKAGLTYGAYLGWMNTPGTTLEIGLLKVKRKYGFKSGTTDLSSSGSAIEIPLMLRLTMIPMLSFGGGVYYAHVSQTETIDGRILGVAVNTKRENSDFRQDDFGLRLSARFEMPLAPLVKLLLEGNYVHGLRDLTVSNTTERKNRELQLLTGVQLGF